MTRDEQFIGQLEDYLDEYEGLTPLPDGVRDAIRAEIPTTRRVNSLPWPFRYINLSTSFPVPARVWLMAVGTIVVVVLGATLFGREIAGPPNPTPTPIPTPLASPGAFPAGPTALAPGDYVYANPYVDDELIRSCEGGCSDYQEITFTLPDGWATADGLVFKHLNQANEVAFSIWTPGDIYLDPCRWTGSGVDRETLEPPDALQEQGGRNASNPVELTFALTFDGAPWPDGQRASRMELSVPADLDISSCDQGEYRSWSEWDVPDGANSHHAAGQVDIVYLIDVDRRLLLIDASYMPGASRADRAELEAIVASMVFHR